MDINLNPSTGNDFVQSNEIDDVLQQIELFFDTTQGDVLGDASFGCDYTPFLHELKVSSGDIERKIKADLQSFVEFGNITYSVSVSILDGTCEDIILVEISLRDKTTNRIVKSNYKI